MHNPTFESNFFKINPMEMPCVTLSALPHQSAGTLNPYTLVTAAKFVGNQIIEGFTEDLHTMSEESRELFRQFIGECPQIGYDIDLTLVALSQNGINPANLHWEIRDIASIIIPDITDLSLRGLTEFFNITSGSHSEPETPAETALRIYLSIMERANGFSASTLSKMAHLASLANSPLTYLFSGLAASPGKTIGTPGGLDYKLIGGDNERSKSVGINHNLSPLDPEYVIQLLSDDGPLRHQFPRYEPRPEQITMARNIAESLNSFLPPIGEPHQLVLEGGTGIGKSIAYLLPSIIFALENDTKIVISTSTIGLQEQLIQKDIPDLLKALAGQPNIDTARLKYASMKGKSNYLCVRRWEQLSNNESLSIEEAITLAKTLTWMQVTSTGDRSEIAINRLQAQTWDQISASNFSRCTGARDGACFYRLAREEAAAANILVVNHALLISDLMFDGTLIPEYGYLIIDEAHNLEEEATRQFGFKMSQPVVSELIEHLSVITQNITASSRTSDLNQTYKESLQLHLSSAAALISRARQAWQQLSHLFALFMQNSNFEKQDLGNAEIESNIRILTSSRAQPAWSEIEIEWDNFERAMSEIGRISSEILQRLGETSMEALLGYENLLIDLSDWIQEQNEMRRKIAGFVNRPNESMVYWISGNTNTIALNGAPLDVGAQLQQELFSNKRSVILTSATMAVSGSFNHLKNRLGLQDADELLLGSPFDYQTAVLLCTPNDMPEPSSPSYLSKLASTIKDLAEAVGGHTLVLFTSHAALRATSGLLKEALVPADISVLAQGVDGSPAQLLGQFQDQPQTILLGTASFWEGIDIVNNELKVLVVARLPFNIPTEPVFEARSQLYDNPFSEYAIPQAILRFRQGFGRLIRSEDDRGAVVILDGRISSKAYGRKFLSSLPTTKKDSSSLQGIGQRVSKWLSCPEE